MEVKQGGNQSVKSEWFEQQVDLAKKLQAVLASGNYPLPVVISTMRMMEFEFMMQSYVQMGIANKAAAGKLETNIDPNLINKLNQKQ